MGSNFGELFAVRFSALFLDKQRVVEFKHDKIPKRSMSISKGFDAFTSNVTSIGIFEG
jgi:hypothetical protein